MNSFYLKFIVIFIIFIGCASSETSTTNRIKKNPYFINRDEIESSIASTAYELIFDARNTWLRPSKFQSFNNSTTAYPIVYVGSHKYGELSSLKSVPTRNISEIQFLRSNDAVTRYGPGHIGGAILIKLIR